MTGFPLRRPGQPEPASEAAAFWVLRQEEGPLSGSEEQQFADWLGEDPAHATAYEDALWALDAATRHAGAAKIMAMRGAALAARGDRRHLWRWTGGSLLAASVAAFLAWTAFPVVEDDVGTATRVVQGPTDPASASYRTAIGERSAITLPDGSVATLDTDSAVRVAYSAGERGVYLLKGQALFDVAKGKPNPFQVYAKGQRITAVGTMFNVRINGDEVRVSMVEGVVRVRPAPAPNRSAAAPLKELTLTGGEELVARRDGPFRVQATDVRQVASWKGGLLIFNDTRLADAVAELNRYTARPIAISDSAVGAYRVSGVFKSNDPERFSQAMTEVFPITLTYGPEGTPTLRSRAN